MQPWIPLHLQLLCLKPSLVPQHDLLLKPKDHLLSRLLLKPTALSLSQEVVVDLSLRRQLLRQLKDPLHHLMRSLKLQQLNSLWCHKVRRIYSLLPSKLLFNHLSASRTWTLLQVHQHSAKASKKLQSCKKNLRHLSVSKMWVLLWLIPPAKALLLSQNKLKHQRVARLWTTLLKQT